MVKAITFCYQVLNLLFPSLSNRILKRELVLVYSAIVSIYDSIQINYLTYNFIKQQRLLLNFEDSPLYTTLEAQ